MHRVRRHRRLGEYVDPGKAAVGEEHGLGMGFEREHVPGPVVLLVLPGLLVLPDNILLVVVDVHAADHAGLDPAAHDLAVEVQRRSAFAYQHALSDEAVECLPRRAIDPGIVWIDVWWEIDVRPPDVEEAVGIPQRQLTGLVPVHHVVGDRGHLGGQGGLRTHSVKGMESHRVTQPE